MADTHSFRLCTVGFLLVATTLLQGCRGQCDGNFEVLVATEQRQILQSPDSTRKSNDMCRWRVTAEGGQDYVVHLQVIAVDLFNAESSECLGSISVYDGAYTWDGKRLAKFCRSQDEHISSSGHNMYIVFTKFAKQSRWQDFTVTYWATKDDSKGAYRTMIARIAGGGVAVLVFLTVLVVIIRCWCRRYRKSPTARSPPPPAYPSHAPRYDSAPPSCHAPLYDSAPPSSHAHQGLSMVSSGMHGPWGPHGVHVTSSGADRPPWDYFPLADLPPSYDAVVGGDKGAAGGLPEGAQPVKLPPYSAVVEMDVATKPV